MDEISRNVYRCQKAGMIPFRLEIGIPEKRLLADMMWPKVDWRKNPALISGPIKIIGLIAFTSRLDSHLILWARPNALGSKPTRFQ